MALAGALWGELVILGKGHRSRLQARSLTQSGREAANGRVSPPCLSPSPLPLPSTLWDRWRKHPPLRVRAFERRCFSPHTLRLPASRGAGVTAASEARSPPEGPRPGCRCPWPGAGAARGPRHPGLRGHPSQLGDAGTALGRHPGAVREEDSTDERATEVAPAVSWRGQGGAGSPGWSLRRRWRLSHGCLSLSLPLSLEIKGGGVTRTQE